MIMEELQVHLMVAGWDDFCGGMTHSEPIGGFNPVVTTASGSGKPLGHRRI